MSRRRSHRSGSSSLAPETGIVAVGETFDFRGVGRSEGVHDHGAGEQEHARALFEVEDRFPGLPLVLGGFRHFFDGQLDVLQGAVAEWARGRPSGDPASPLTRAPPRQPRRPRVEEGASSGSSLAGEPGPRGVGSRRARPHARRPAIAWGRRAIPPPSQSGMPIE